VFYFNAIVNFQVGATNRYDPGVYFSYSNTNALTGTCGATYMSLGWTEERVAGISNKEETKGNDTCADVGSANDVVVLMRVATKCLNSNSNTSYADVQYCTTWHQNAGGDCYDINDLYPSSGSKCYCGSYDDLFYICQRCTITPTTASVSRSCGATTGQFAAQTGDFTFSAGCQSSTISYTDTTTGPCGVTRTATAQDSCGNTVTSSSQIVSRDCSQSCLLSTTTAGKTYECDASRTASNSDVITTGCSSVSSSDASFTGPCGTYTRTWSAVDVCGTSYSYAQTISVVDSTPPTVTCPTGSAAILNCGTPTGADTCGIDTVESTGGAEFNGVEVVYNAVDQCGNHVHVTCDYSCADYEYVAQ